MRHPDVDVLAVHAVDPEDAPAEVRTHLASCATCRRTVDDLLAVAAGARTVATDPGLVAPRAGLRDQVLAAAFAEEQAGPESTPAPVVPLDTAARSRRGTPWWLTTMAAALALVAGVGLGRSTAPTETVPGDPAPSESVLAATELTSLEGEADRGVARVVRTDDTVTLRVRASELGGAPGIHEVWLLNVDGTRMVALGLLTSGENGEFSVPVELLDEGYRIVDISVEPDDGDPTHSGVSLARGELA